MKNTLGIRYGRRPFRPMIFRGIKKTIRGKNRNTMLLKAILLLLSERSLKRCKSCSKAGKENFMIHRTRDLHSTGRSDVDAAEQIAGEREYMELPIRYAELTPITKTCVQAGSFRNDSSKTPFFVCTSSSSATARACSRSLSRIFAPPETEAFSGARASWS